MVTHERLLEVLNYDPSTGAFTWRFQISNRVSAGSIAGSFTDDGYICISLDGKRYRAHRLAWLYMTSVWPEFFIDHKDNNRSNNEWSNLRQATKSENNHNRVLNSNNSTGVKGVTQLRDSGKYVAVIKHNNITYRVGTFKTLDSAAEAIRLKREQLHDNFANHG